MQILKKRFSSDENINLELLKLENINLNQVEILNNIINRLLKKIGNRLELTEKEVRSRITFLSTDSLSNFLYMTGQNSNPQILFQNSNDDLIERMYNKYKVNPKLEFEDVGILLDLQKLGFKNKYAPSPSERKEFIKDIRYRFDDTHVLPDIGNSELNRSESIKIYRYFDRELCDRWDSMQEEKEIANKFIRQNRSRQSIGISSSTSFKSWRKYKYYNSSEYSQKVAQQMYLNTLISIENKDSISKFFNVQTYEIAFSLDKLEKHTKVYVGDCYINRYRNLSSLEKVTGDFTIWKVKFPIRLYNLIEIQGNAIFNDWDGEAPNLISINGSANFSGCKGKVDLLIKIGGDAIFGESVKFKQVEYKDPDDDRYPMNEAIIETRSYLCKPWSNSAPNLKYIGGNANFLKWEGKVSKLLYIGGNAIFNEWKHDASSLIKIQGNAIFGSRSLTKGQKMRGYWKFNTIFGPWLGSAPNLEFIGGDLQSEDWKGRILKTLLDSKRLEAKSSQKLDKDEKSEPDYLEYIKFKQNKLEEEEYYRLNYKPDEDYDFLFQRKNAMIMKFKNESLIVLSIYDSNITSPIHEIIHEFERALNSDEIEIIETWSNTLFNSTDFSEFFALGAEKYIYENHHLDFDPKLFKLSKWFQETITNQEAYFKNLPKLNNDIRELYFQIFST